MGATSIKLGRDIIWLEVEVLMLDYKIDAGVFGKIGWPTPGWIWIAALVKI